MKMLSVPITIITVNGECEYKLYNGSIFHGKNGMKNLYIECVKIWKKHDNKIYNFDEFVKDTENFIHNKSDLYKEGSEFAYTSKITHDQSEYNPMKDIVYKLIKLDSD